MISQSCHISILMVTSVLRWQVLSSFPSIATTIDLSCSAPWPYNTHPWTWNWNSRLRVGSNLAGGWWSQAQRTLHTGPNKVKTKAVLSTDILTEIQKHRPRSYETENAIYTHTHSDTYTLCKRMCDSVGKECQCFFQFSKSEGKTQHLILRMVFPPTKCLSWITSNRIGANWIWCDPRNRPMAPWRSMRMRNRLSAAN